MTSSILRRIGATAAMMALAALVACAGDAITPPPAPKTVASVAVTPASHSLMVGAQVTLQARPKAADGEELQRAVTWSSENEQLASVSAEGVVTALAAGQVGIRASSEGRYGRAVLTVTAIPQVPVAEVRLSADDEIVLEWDGRVTITATAYDADGNELTDRSIQWLSTKPSVAAVWSGNIEAVNPGVAIITAVIEGKAASVGVRVKQAPVTAVSVEAVTTGLEVGETFTFAARITRANGWVGYGPASWYSSNEFVARVAFVDMTYAGIEALAEGTTAISAVVEGVTGTMEVRVTGRPTEDLIYNRTSGLASEIFTLDIAGSGLPVRINAGEVSRDPSPSPDGTQLVFAVSQVTALGAYQHDLFVVNRNGLNMRWLTRAEGMEDYPQWSPDGTKILFHGTIGGKSDLFTINLDGSGLTNLTEGLTQFASKSQPAWSPDGSRIAFIGVQGSAYKVWTMNAEGGDLKQVTTDAGFDMMPAFSPDGQKIAFVRYNNETPGFGDDVLIVPAAGGTPVRLGLVGDQRTPAWSSDGVFIAVSGNAVAGSGTSEIYTLRPDGTGLRLRTINPAWGGGMNPAWMKRP